MLNKAGKLIHRCGYLDNILPNATVLQASEY